jgi:hypothetical protein
LKATLGKGATERRIIGSSDGESPDAGNSFAIAHHSGYGHTRRQAEAVKCGVEQWRGAEALLLSVDEGASALGRSDLRRSHHLRGATYTGGPSAQFKAFEDASAHAVMTQGHGWKDKIAAGFTNLSRAPATSWRP